MISRWSLVAGKLGVYLHWRVLCCGCICSGLDLLGGLFGRWVPRRGIDLIKGRLRGPGRVNRVGHDCDR